MTIEASLAAGDGVGVQSQPALSGSRGDLSMMEIGVSAAIIAVLADEPRVLVVRHESDPAGLDGLPYGAFSPFEHRTLDVALRTWVRKQTGLALGDAEQLYTFADRTRLPDGRETPPHLVSIGYLALTRASTDDDLGTGEWKCWYDYFPWEDWRSGRPTIIESVIEPALRQWAERTPASLSSAPAVGRMDLVRMAFGVDGATWDEEKVLERYELLYDAGLLDEPRRDGREPSPPVARRLGLAMRHDQRRILATAIGRVRTKIKYRPVIFEMMDEEFTLFELQKTVEAILGPHLHKQNFRRLVESAGLVELTGDVRVKTGGRPAKLYRFRREVLLERSAPGVRVKAGRA